MADAGLDKAERGHMSVKLAMGDPATSFEAWRDIYIKHINIGSHSLE